MCTRGRVGRGAAGGSAAGVPAARLPRPRPVGARPRRPPVLFPSGGSPPPLRFPHSLASRHRRRHHCRRFCGGTRRRGGFRSPTGGTATIPMRRDIGEGEGPARPYVHSRSFRRDRIHRGGNAASASPPAVRADKAVPPRTPCAGERVPSAGVSTPRQRVRGERCRGEVVEQRGGAPIAMCAGVVRGASSCGAGWGCAWAVGRVGMMAHGDAMGRGGVAW